MCTFFSLHEAVLAGRYSCSDEYARRWPGNPETSAFAESTVHSKQWPVHLFKICDTLQPDRYYRRHSSSIDCCQPEPVHFSLVLTWKGDIFNAFSAKWILIWEGILKVTEKKNSVGWTIKNKQLHVAAVFCFTSPISPKGTASISECTCEGWPPLMSRWQLMMVSTCSWINICTWVNVTRGFTCWLVVFKLFHIINP